MFLVFFDMLPQGLIFLAIPMLFPACVLGASVIIKILRLAALPDCLNLLR